MCGCLWLELRGLVSPTQTVGVHLSMCVYVYSVNADTQNPQGFGVPCVHVNVKKIIRSQPVSRVTADLF